MCFSYTCVGHLHLQIIYISFGTHLWIRSNLEIVNEISNLIMWILLLTLVSKLSDVSFIDFELCLILWLALTWALDRMQACRTQCRMARPTHDWWCAHSRSFGRCPVGWRWRLRQHLQLLPFDCRRHWWLRWSRGCVCRLPLGIGKSGYLSKQKENFNIKYKAFFKCRWMWAIKARVQMVWCCIIQWWMFTYRVCIALLDFVCVQTVAHNVQVKNLTHFGFITAKG